MKRFLLSAAALVAGAALATAAEPIEITANTDYALTGADAVFLYHSTSAGKGIFHPGNAFQVYLDADCTDEVETDFQGYANGGEKTLMLEAGKDYYFKQTNDWYNWTAFQLQLEQPLEFLHSLPESGSKLSITTNKQVDLWFSQKVKIGKAVLKVAGSEITLSPSGGFSISPYVPVESVLSNLYAQNVLYGGEKVVVECSGITTDDGKAYEENNGVITLEFIMAAKPISRVGYKEITGDFLYEWPVGDPRAVMEYTMSGPVGEIYAVLSIGNPEAESETEFYTETVPGYTDGNKGFVDFSGKSRTSVDMFTAKKYYNAMNVKVYVLDADGFPAVSTEPGSVGSFSHNFLYVDYVPKVYGDDFTVTPAPGEVEYLETFEIVPGEGQAVVTGEGSATLNGNNGLSYPVEIVEGEGLKIVLKVTERITEPGEYTLTLPDSYFKWITSTATYHNPAKDYTFLISKNDDTGVDAVSGHSAYTVYDFQGNLLLKEADSTAYGNLPSGWYIVNGLKVKK